MKVGLSTIITPQSWSFDQMLQEAAAAGYEAVEVCIRDEGDIRLDTPESELKAMAERAAAAGIELSSACASVRNQPRDLMTNDCAVWQQSIETIKSCLKVTKGLGIGNMLLTLGALTDDLYYNEAYANSLKALQLLAPVAEELEVNLAIEYVWNKFLLSPMEFAQFCDSVGSKRVGLFFDTGNMVIFGFPQHWVRICGKHLMMVHFKDFKRMMEWKPLLEGDVNFPAVMAELRKIGYDGPLLSEVDPNLASLPDTAAAIRKIMEM
ncbi:MAG: sugar phosphate isomerase/epimerase family protein [Armatimonadota bacterium]